MAHHKLQLDSFEEEPYTLLAIHCSEEAFKVAYLLNRRLYTQFKRRRMDLDFPSEGLVVSFPIFHFADHNYNQFYLVANKCRYVESGLQISGGLFSEAERTTTHFLLPEFKKIDYFLKIYSDFENISLQTLVAKIKAIEQIVSVYPLQPEAIKRKNNLIFE